MRTDPQFSFIRSLRSAIKTGTLVDEDLIFSNEIERRVQSTESLRYLRGSGLPAGARSFFCPVNFARRDVSAGAGGAGIVDKSYLQFSDLLTYSTAIQQGALSINDAIGSAYLGMVSSLPLCAFGSLSSYSKAIYQKIRIPVDLLCRDPGRKKFYSLTVRRHKMISPRSGPFKCSEVERANGSSSLGPR